MILLLGDVAGLPACGCAQCLLLAIPMKLYNVLFQSLRSCPKVPTFSRLNVTSTQITIDRNAEIGRFRPQMAFQNCQIFAWYTRDMVQPSLSRSPLVQTLK